MDESDGEESVVSDSEESDRTPSPSILGGLELLNRKTVIRPNDVLDASCDDKHFPEATSENDTAIGTSGDDEQKKRDYSDRTTSGMNSSYNLAAYPFFKTVKNYNHSPVFTPPRKFFKPASSHKTETDVLHGPSAKELPVGAGPPDVCSQVLFSGSQGSSPSQSSSLRQGECAKSVQGDQEKVLPNSTCSVFDSKCSQSLNSEGKLSEQVKQTEGEKSSAGSMEVQLAQNLSNSGTTHEPTIHEKVEECPQSDNQLISCNNRKPHCLAVDKMCFADDIYQIEKNIQNESTLPSDRRLFPDSGHTENVPQAPFQSCDERETPVSHSSGNSSTCTNVDIISKSTACAETQSSHLTCEEPQGTWDSSEEDDSKSLKTLEKAYKTLNNLVEKDEEPLSVLKERLKELQEAMKAEAQKIQQQRGHIMNCDHTKMSDTQQQLQKQELLNLSRMQRHLLYILNIHKRVASKLSSKQMSVQAMDIPHSQMVTLPSCTTNNRKVLQTLRSEQTPKKLSQDTSEMKSKDKTVAENPATRALQVMTCRTEQEKGGTQDVGSEPASQSSQSAAIQTPMPQLVVKDLIENGFLEPLKGCMSFLHQGRQLFGDLQLDGSIMSEGVLYKTEKEWYTSKCNQPASSIRKPKLWNLIKYNGTPLKNLADQCQLLCIAKKIEVPKAVAETSDVSVKNVEVSRPSFLKPTAKLSSCWPIGGKTLQPRDLFDPTVIKSVVLIGDNELFSEDELLTNGFWENEGCQGSSIPFQWLKEISSWED